MPIYEYECTACGEELEVIQKFSDKPKRKCPACGALKLRRKVSRSSFHLKGSGWYVTDYGSNGSKGKSESESSSKSESSNGESKPAKAPAAEKPKATESKSKAGTKSSD